MLLLFRKREGEEDNEERVEEEREDDDVVRGCDRAVERFAICNSDVEGEDEEQLRMPWEATRASIIGECDGVKKMRKEKDPQKIAWTAARPESSRPVMLFLKFARNLGPIWVVCWLYCFSQAYNSDRDK